jgi:hypothetical protein
MMTLVQIVVLALETLKAGLEFAITDEGQAMLKAMREDREAARKVFDKWFGDFTLLANRIGAELKKE